MSNHLIARATSLAPLAAVLLFASSAALAQQATSAAAPTAASGDCDRACLRQALDTYLMAVFKHDPSAARLTADHYATNNTAVVRNGEGFWKDISGYGELQRRYFDPVNGAAAYLGLLKQNGKDVVSSIRIKVEGGKVSEAEWFIDAAGDPQRLVKYPPPESPLPESQRSTRFYVISMANDYFQSAIGHDASWIPTDLRCSDKDPNPITSSPRHADICHDTFPVTTARTKDLALRRFPLVDEEMGMVLGAAVWVRYAGQTAPDNVVNEYFQVANGTFVYIWTANYQLPKGALVTTGWEDKQGDITR